MAEEMKVRNTLNYQINEKISETEYDVLHPETHVDVVITTDAKQFVSKAEKEKWDTLAAYGLTYQGVWTSTDTYAKNAVVSYNGKYYIGLVASNVNHQPNETADTDYWANINIEAYIAERADRVKVVDASGNSYKPVLINGGEEGTTGYKDINSAASMTYSAGANTLKIGDKITLDGSTGNITVEQINGTAVEATHAATADRATEAEKYVKYKRTDNGDLDGERTEAGNAYIDDDLRAIEKRLADISGGTGGAVLSHGLTIKKDGVIAVDKFTGRTAEEVDIKQTFAYNEITGLLDTNNKIKEDLLPDSILGQLEYQGTFDPSVVGTAEAVKGYYYIAGGNGNYNPDGTASDAGYEIGDWAVFNGTGWDKIDNTDAVRMVNSQIGNVETYKTWVANGQFYRGDIVKINDILYICNKNFTEGTDFTAANWDIFGRTYTGADGIKVEGGIIKHDVTLENGATTNVTLGAGETFNVPSITRDAFGHVTKIDVKTITLGADFVDTTREIQLDGTAILAGTGANKNKALNVKGSNWIDVKYENDALNFEHKVADATKGVNEYKAEKINNDAEADELFAGQGYTIPTFTTDAAGHIVAASVKKFKLADAMIKHEHFNIVKDAAGAQTIKAYDTATATPEWLNNAANTGKFYKKAEKILGLVGGFDADTLYQKGNAVLDQTAKVISGLGYDTETGTFTKELAGTYSAAKGGFELADAVTEGTYSAVHVNKKGIIVAGGQIVEFGTEVNADPSASLAVGGLFFRKLA